MKLFPCINCNHPLVFDWYKERWMHQREDLTECAIPEPKGE